MNNARRRKNLMLRRISGETEQSSEISSTQENLIGQCSNLFTITDVRSLSEQNYEHNELIPINQALDSSSATRADYYSLQPNRFQHPFFSNVYVDDNIQQFNQPDVDLLNSINLLAAPNTANQGNVFPETVKESEVANGENNTNNNTSASVNKESKRRSTEQNPAVVLNDISNSDKIGKQENHVQATDDTNDEFISFEEKLTKHLRQMPLRSALLLQKEIQDIIIMERVKCLEEQ